MMFFMETQETIYNNAQTILGGGGGATEEYEEEEMQDSIGKTKNNIWNDALC